MTQAIEKSDIIVALDAATPILSVALAGAGGRSLAMLRRESRQPASEALLSDLNHLMAAEPRAAERVRAVAVTLGPGMFTGLRVGLAVAKTLAHGWGVPLYGVSTLAAAAARWPVAGDSVCVLLDARRGEIYSGVYRLRGDGGPEAMREDRVQTLEQFLDDMDGLDLASMVFSGGGAALHREGLARHFGSRARFVPALWGGPGADGVALLTARDVEAGVAGLDPLAAVPIYLRVSDAERRHGKG